MFSFLHRFILSANKNVPKIGLRIEVPVHNTVTKEYDEVEPADDIAFVYDNYMQHEFPYEAGLRPD